MKSVFEIVVDLACEHALKTLLLGAELSRAVLGCTGSPLAGPERIRTSTHHCAKIRAQILPTHAQGTPTSLG